MKKFIVILLVMLSVSTIRAQDSAASDYTQIRPQPLTIAVGKTTNLIYPLLSKVLTEAAGIYWSRKLRDWKISFR